MSRSAPEPRGCARRAIDLRASGDAVIAWLEDDFHHFGIELLHDGARVLAVQGHAERFPRDTCPGAIGILQELVGTSLHERSTALGAHTNMRQHCTHLYDLLGLAIAHAANGREHRRYDAVVPDREAATHVDESGHMGGRTEPVLYRDGKEVMRWRLQGELVEGPGPYAGVSLGRGFRAWTESLDVEEAEAAHVLRRATLIALGRLIDLQAMPADALKWTEGLCHSFQPETFARSTRTPDSIRDFTDNPRGPLKGL